MWERYLKVIREKCSQALHILDRFHIVAKMNKTLDEVRAEESRRIRHEGRDPVLKKSRWLLLKRQRTSRKTSPSRSRSAPLQPENRPCLPSQGSFPATMGLPGRRPGPASSWTNGAGRPCAPDRAHEGDRTHPAPTPRSHPKLIPCAKADRQRRGRGSNNKAKVTMRRSYGFRTHRVLELALYHSLGKLPEP
jgi:transposase